MKKLTAKIAFEGQPAWVKSATVDWCGMAIRYSQPCENLETTPLNRWHIKQPFKNTWEEIDTGFDAANWKSSAIDRDFNEFPAPDDNKTIVKKEDENAAKELPTFESGLFEKYPEANFWRVDEGGTLVGSIKNPYVCDDAEYSYWYADGGKFFDEGSNYDASNWKTWKLDRADYEEWLKYKSSNGQKHDQSKPRHSILPSATLSHVIAVLEFGAGKYGVDNWQQVQNPRTRYYDACMRHIDSWWSGEINDIESGKHHLAHAICCLLFLMWFDFKE